MWHWHTRIEIVNDITYPIIKDCSRLKLCGFFPTTKTEKTNYAVNFKSGDKITQLYYISEKDHIRQKKWNRAHKSRYMNVNMLKETPFSISVQDMKHIEECECYDCCDCCDFNSQKNCENLTTKKQLCQNGNETPQFAKWYFILKLKR